MMGRTNDMLIYGSEVFLQVDYRDDEKLQDYIKKAVSSSSKSYGSPFQEIFKKARGDFYKIDPTLFAPAKLIVNNVYSGSVFSAGKINIEMIKGSIENR
jgi:methenyltetrahydromethanopterin cyclohydrolase